MEHNKESIIMDLQEMNIVGVSPVTIRNTINFIRELTAKNEWLKNRLLIADEDIKRLRNQVTANIILTAKDAEKIKTECLEKIQLDVKAIKADTVRKMQEKLRDGHLTATNPNVICLYESELDQIAKEVLEELKP